MSIAFIAIPLLLALLAQGMLGVFSAANPGSYLLVTDSDGNKQQLSLSSDSRSVINTSLGQNIVVVAEGKAFIEAADCHGGDCVAHAPISAAGENIICLPHRLVLEVRGGDFPGDVQAGNGQPGGGQPEVHEPLDMVTE